MRPGAVAGLALCTLALAGCLGVPSGLLAGAAPVPEPVLPGPLPAARVPYDFGLTVVEDPRTGHAYPARLAGSLHYPVEGPGPFPVLVFMHGRHSTCRLLDLRESAGQPVCPDAPPAARPVRSHEGYAYVAENLATHGYVVASIDANDVNDRDEGVAHPLLGLPLGAAGVEGDHGNEARAQLVVRTLDRLLELHARGGDPVGDALTGRLDVDRIGLMGHSRGGEGVTHAIRVNAERADGPVHAIRAVFSLAPADFLRVVAPDVAYLVLLPSCDGDVTNLWGAWTYDDSRYLRERTPAPKHQLLARGANHNFYNTLWTFDEGDFGDPYCGAAAPGGAPEGGRLSAEDQRRHGLAAVAAFFRHYLGGEAGFGPWLRGEAPPPAAACPGGQGPCGERLLMSYHPAPGDRLVVEDTLDDGALLRNDLGGATLLQGFRSAATCDAQECARTTAGSAHQLALAWDGAATLATSLPPAQGDLRGWGALAFRAGVGFEGPGGGTLPPLDVHVVLTDAAGRSASVRALDHTHALFVPPGSERTCTFLGFTWACGSQKVVLNTVRVPLEAFQGIDRGQVRGIALAFGEPGAVQLTDLMLQR